MKEHTLLSISGVWNFQFRLELGNLRKIEILIQAELNFLVFENETILILGLLGKLQSLLVIQSRRGKGDRPNIAWVGGKIQLIYSHTCEVHSLLLQK